ncbi:MAG: hypothetical protein ACI97R_001704, partial [Candidatus Azotimanducaceae bacterium]
YSIAVINLALLFDLKIGLASIKVQKKERKRFIL